MSNAIHTEAIFEAASVEHLTANGWQQGSSDDFSADLAMDKKAVLFFVQASQPKEWQNLQSYYREDTESKFFQRLCKELDLRGMLEVIRHGITDSGVKFRLAYFKPASKLNPNTLAFYNCNRLKVTRQVYFSSKNNLLLWKNDTLSFAR